MKRVELLAPAGNLEKAKIALHYGADAVYVGGKELSLRARASNFTLGQIKELVEFAHERNKKVYVTTNIIPHNEDLAVIDSYLKALEKMQVDAIIASSPYIIERARIITPNLPRHLSTQMSTTNSLALKVWARRGVERVVLAREVTLAEMKQIAINTPVELEVFIHGGMCSSYSGRCVLSNEMTRRDANRGGCAHSCRWNYTLYRNGEALPGIFNFGSKDLMALPFIPELIEMGIASLKIEGRMKSVYYLATVVRSYRMFIDAYYQKGYVTEEDLEKASKEIEKAENRETGTGFYLSLPNEKGQLYDNRSEHPTKEYVGYVLDYDQDTQIAIIEQRNYFEVGDEVEFFGPKLENTNYIIPRITDAITGEELTVARHPLQQLLIKVPFTIEKHDMMRLKIKD